MQAAMEAIPAEKDQHTQEKTRQPDGGGKSQNPEKPEATGASEESRQNEELRQLGEGFAGIGVAGSQVIFS